MNRSIATFISNCLLVGLWRRVGSAEFLGTAFGQNIADFISPKRWDVFSPLINSFTCNSKRFREFAHVISKFFDGVFSSHGAYSKHASDY